MKTVKRHHILFSLVLFLVFGTNVAMGQIRSIGPKISKKTEASSRNKKVPSDSQRGERRLTKKTTVRTSEHHLSSKAVLQNLISNMVPVEGGTFNMGATQEQGNDAGTDEKPAHRVMLASFSIGKYEVTQEEWKAVMGNNPSHFKGSKRPVEQVSWNDCLVFIEKLNTMTGRHFRLPTEAEWEYAARGGSKSKSNKFAGSNNAEEVAWYNYNSDNETHEVGKKHANELGLFDMAGNVWEWCSDHKVNYENGSANEASANEISLNQADSNRVNRGGSWRSSEKLCRVSFRFDDDATERFNTVGLRLAE